MTPEEIVKAVVALVVGLFAVIGAIYAYKKQKELTRTEQAKNAAAIQQSNAKVIEKIAESDQKQTESINALLVNYDELQAKYSELYAQFSQMQEYIYGLQKKITILLDLHKNPNDSDRLVIKLRHTIDFLASKTHKEIRLTLINALDEISPILATILGKDFSSVNRDVLYDDLKRKAKSLRPKINFKALTLIKDKEKLLEQLSEAIDSDLMTFCDNVAALAVEKTNGDRVEEFFTECKNLVASVTKKTISIYDSNTSVKNA